MLLGLKRRQLSIRHRPVIRIVPDVEYCTVVDCDWLGVPISFVGVVLLLVFCCLVLYFVVFFLLYRLLVAAPY